MFTKLMTEVSGLVRWNALKTKSTAVTQPYERPVALLDQLYENGTGEYRHE